MQAKQQTLSVLIVGCGNIAGRFDENNALTALPYTHAGAYQQDGRFELLACVEPNVQRQAEFMDFWGVNQGFVCLDELLNADLSFDVISICSPTARHIEDLKKAIQLKPKLIFCEKPLSTEVIEAENIVKACKKKKILLAVNYTRSWDPTLQQLKSDIQTGLWGELRSVVGTYNKGILNNGSHLLDLLFYLLGDLKVLSVTQPIFDFFLDDPTVSALLESSHGVLIHLVSAHAQDYALFEVQFIFQKGVLVMEEGGMVWRKREVEQSAIFAGYHYLNQGQFDKGGYEQAMLAAVDNIYQAIDAQQVLLKTGSMVLKVQKFCEQIKQMSLLKIKHSNDE